jgi:nucleotide-binding universal stress UspA family protein
MATIVCAVDGSPEARDALRTATALSNALGLRLVLAHVAKRIRHREGPGQADEARDEAAGLLARLCAEHGLDGRTERRVELGDCATELARIAAEEAATVILLGSGGPRRLRQRLISDLASELSGTSTCPVVVVVPSSNHEWFDRRFDRQRPPCS